MAQPPMCEAVATVNVSALACCAPGKEVWLAKQCGSIVVHDAHSGKPLGQVEIGEGGSFAPLVRAMIVVFGEVWAATAEGRLLCIDSATRTISHSMPLARSEARDTVRDMCFNGHTVAIALGRGEVLVMHPLQRKVQCSLRASSPCTAVIHYYGFIVAGDCDGGLFVWDPVTGERVIEHTRGQSEVTQMLHERSTGTIWVGRRSGHLDAYKFSGREISLVTRVRDVGRVTGLAEVSGKVVATTYERRLLVISADTGEILHETRSAHASFIHGITKVQHAEVSRLWSFANEEVVHTWEVTGYQVPVARAPYLHPRKQAQLASDAHAALLLQNGELAVRTEKERGRAVSLEEELRALREEAQELRLKLLKREEALDEKDKDLSVKVQRLQELDTANATANSRVVELAANVASVERQRVELQDELSQVREDLSRARTEAYNRQSEIFQLQQQLSQEKTNAHHLEQRLRDANERTTTIQSENTRLCNAIGSVAVAQNAEKDVHKLMMQGNAEACAELADAKGRNAMLSALLVSMEYTVRRMEEEGRDTTALLNAFRRKLSARVTDPHLTALLNVTMVRNPHRFEWDCDEATRAQLRDRHGPFIQFIHTLQQSDPEAYEKLVRFLQQSGDEPYSKDSANLFQQILNAAQQEGHVENGLIASFARSIPSLMCAGELEGRGESFLPGGHGGGLSGTAGMAGGGDLSSHMGGMNSGQTLFSYPQAQAGLPGHMTSNGGTASPTSSHLEPHGGSNEDALGVLRNRNTDDKVDEETLRTSLLREIRMQSGVSDQYMREQRTIFEFILKTRRALVESLVLVQKRTVSAKQVVDALSMGPSLTSPMNAPGAEASSPSLRQLQPLQHIMSNILEELVQLMSTIVSTFCTQSEKQRLSVR